METNTSCAQNDATLWNLILRSNTADLVDGKKNERQSLEPFPLDVFYSLEGPKGTGEHGAPPGRPRVNYPPGDESYVLE